MPVVMRLDGAVRRFSLAPSSLLVGGPVWSSAGKSLIYASVSTENDLELFSITPQGGGVRQLTHNRVDDLDPAWSPDGRRIVFARGKVDTSNRVRRSSLYLMDSSGRHVRRLTRGGLDTGPSWAPDGKRVVFVRNDGLYLLALGSARVHALGAGPSTEPAWSPDGRLIAFGDLAELKVIRPDGKGGRTLFDGGAAEGDIPAEVSGPSWSPDGRAVAFHLLYDHGRWLEESEVVVSRAGQDRRTLFCRLPYPPAFEPEAGMSSTAAWSPDGHWIAVGGVAVCRIDGSAGYWLTPGVRPDWQLRGR